MEKEFIKSLRQLIESKRVLETKEDIIAASYDASRLQHLPDIVVKPINCKEVSGILKAASSQSVPVYTRGAASSVTGSAVPIKGGIALDISLMNRIIEINPINMNAVVEPGVVVGDFQKEVEKRNLFYPPDPASADFCTIGGNVATGAGGLRCLKYGTTRDYVLGLEVVLADGRIINTGRGTLKRVSGYDLTRLMVGSEGTLGVITRITLKLIPKPSAVATILVYFREINDALNFSTKLLDKGIVPRALEFMDTTSLKAVKNYKKELEVPEDARAMLLIELDGHPADVEKQAQEVVALREDSIVELKRARDKNETKLLWSVRKSTSPAMYSITSQKFSEDICLPCQSIIPMMKFVRELEAESGITIASFGHLGDGNVHMNFLPANEEQANKLDQALDRLFRKTIELGGTLSGEHGIGLTKAKYFHLEWGEKEIAVFKSIKQLFDPKGILNPGKIFEFRQAD